MTSFAMSPEIRAFIEKAKANGGSVQCDPRRMYPAGNICAGSTRPVPYISRGKPMFPHDPIADSAILVKPPIPTRDGGAVLEIETATDNITATTDANGALTKVDVKNKWLVPAIIVGSLFLFGG